MFHLIDFHKIPPGGYYFHEDFEKDGRKKRKVFQTTPEAGTLAARITNFRKANSLPRADVMSALEDLESFTIARLPVGNRWTHDTEVPFTQLVAAAYGPNCRTCGFTSPPT